MSGILTSETFFWLSVGTVTAIVVTTLMYAGVLISRDS